MTDNSSREGFSLRSACPERAAEGLVLGSALPAGAMANASVGR